MIDTVSLKFPISLPPSLLETWFKHLDQCPDGRYWTKYSLHSRFCNGEDIFYKYYPQDIWNEQNSMLIIEFSLPRILFGNNIFMLENQNDIFDALNIANKLVSEEWNFPIVNLNEGKIDRLDLCYNHFLGERVGESILALQKLKYPFRKTKPYLENGVVYFSKQNQSKFYDKEMESKSSNAYGILRQEKTIRDPEVFLKRFGDGNPILSLVTPEKIRNLLEEDLVKLNLNNTVLGNRDVASEILFRKYGPTKGDHLLGYLVRSNEKTNKQMQDIYGQSRYTHSRKRKAIIDAGVSMALIDAKIPLPTLSINF